MHDWTSFAATTTTLALGDGTTSVTHATRVLYSLPRGVTFTQTHLFTWVQTGDMYEAEFSLDRSQYDVVFNLCVNNSDVRTILLTKSADGETKCDLTSDLVLLLVASVFTNFTVKLQSSQPVEHVYLSFSASLYDAATRQKLTMQPWKTETHRYELGRAVNLKK